MWGTPARPTFPEKLKKTLANLAFSVGGICAAQKKRRRMLHFHWRDTEHAQLRHCGFPDLLFPATDKPTKTTEK